LAWGRAREWSSAHGQVSGATKAEAERKVRALVQAKHQDRVPTNSRQTLQWLRDEWLKTKAHREAQTRHFCEHKSALYVLPRLGHLTLKQLDTREAKGTLQAWVNDLAKVKHLSPKTVKHARDILRSILHYGIESGYLTHDATKKLELPPISTGYRFAMLDDAAYAKLQTAANGQPLQAAYVLMFQHSMRPGEVAGVCWPDIDLERRTMTIRHSLEWLKDERRFNRKSIKNEVIETVDLTDAEIALLKARRKQQFVERGNAGHRWQGSEWDLVFTTTTGAPFHHSGIYKQFRRLLQRIGWTQHTRPYDVRHTGISWVEEHFGMKAAQEQARHKQFSTTANFYVHLSRERRREIATSMGAKVLPLSGTGG